MGFIATPPVELSEPLHRQVGPGGNPIYFDADRAPPILHYSLFLPGRDDADGLSLIRARHRTPIWSAFRPETLDVRYRLACLTAEDVANRARVAGFSVNFDLNPDSLDHRFGEPWAHCVVREINRTAYDTDKEAKRRIKDWAHRMVEQIAPSKVIGPFAEPSPADTYRPMVSAQGPAPSSPPPPADPTVTEAPNLWQRLLAGLFRLARTAWGWKFGG
jgi:hypothetical protein